MPRMTPSTSPPSTEHRRQCRQRDHAALGRDADAQRRRIVPVRPGRRLLRARQLHLRAGRRHHDRRSGHRQPRRRRRDAGGHGFSLNINAGGGAYTAVDGTEFIADAYFSGGIVKTYSSSIAGTQDDTLYRSERTDGDFGYAIPVANGTYAVTLDFAENFVGSAGRRVFDVEIEDGLVIDDLDIFAEAAARTSPIPAARSPSKSPTACSTSISSRKSRSRRSARSESAPSRSSVQAPVAVDDSYATDEDTPLTVAAAGVLANDNDANGDPLAASGTRARRTAFSRSIRTARSSTRRTRTSPEPTASPTRSRTATGTATRLPPRSPSPQSTTPLTVPPTPMRP